MVLKLLLHQLDQLARSAGYEDYKSALHELYVTQGLGLAQLASRFNISQGRVRRHLARFEIPLHGRGGLQHRKVIVTQELLQEIAREGVPAVAAKLGVEPPILYQKLKQVKY